MWPDYSRRSWRALPGNSNTCFQFSSAHDFMIQYVGGDENTVPFSEAPSAVVRARDMIHRRMQQASLQVPGFNEVLSAAYMEKQKMAV